MRVHGAVVAVKVEPPHFVEQFFAAERDAVVLCHVEEQFVFLGREVDAHAVHIDVPARHVDLQPLEFEDVPPGGTVCRRLAAHDGAHARGDFLGRKGLGHIVVHADLEPEEFVILLPARRKHDDGHILGLADLLDGGKAVEAGHHDVHQHDVVIVFAALFDRLHAVRRFVRLVALEFDVFLQNVADHLLVVHDQYFHPYPFSSVFCLFFNYKPFVCRDNKKM